MRRRAWLTILMVAGLQCASAQAACVAPPGTAAVDQYCELIQGPAGEFDSATQKVHVGVPSRVFRQVAAAGPGGAALLAAVGGEPVRVSSVGRPPAATQASARPRLVMESSVGRASGGGPEIGTWFYVLLVLVCAACAIWKLDDPAPRRGRRRS